MARQVTDEGGNGNRKDGLGWAGRRGARLGKEVGRPWTQGL